MAFHSLEKYQWRSNLSKIEILNEKQFIEYIKDGFAAIKVGLITLSETSKSLLLFMLLRY